MSEPESKKKRAIDFAQRLMRRRVDLGFSQADLAARANDYLPEKRSFSRASVSRYESGENIPGPATLKALAQALNCEMTDLVPENRLSPLPRAPVTMEMDDDGNVKLVVNTTVPFDVAQKIFALLPKR